MQRSARRLPDSSAIRSTLAGVLPTRRYRVAGRPRLRAHVMDVGMACCAVEFAAAVGRGLLLPAEDAREDPGDDDEPLHVLIVSGTVTHPQVPAVVEAWESLPEPRVAVAFGACTISGGPYWDSYAVVPGIDGIVPVARFVPGCPPRPEAVLEALDSLDREQPITEARRGSGGVATSTLPPRPPSAEG